MGFDSPLGQCKNKIRESEMVQLNKVFFWFATLAFAYHGWRADKNLDVARCYEGCTIHQPLFWRYMSRAEQHVSKMIRYNDYREELNQELRLVVENRNG
jgi:hypothetical protein